MLPGRYNPEDSPGNQVEEGSSVPVVHVLQDSRRGGRCWSRGDVLMTLGAPPWMVREVLGHTDAHLQESAHASAGG